MIFNILILVYIISIVSIIVYFWSVENSVKKSLGSLLYIIWRRRRGLLINSIKNNLIMLCPILNTTYFLLMLFNRDVIMSYVNMLICESFDKWGIDFNKVSGRFVTEL